MAVAREALIDAAATLLADRGDASVRQIARLAGVNHGLVHHYFGSKQALFDAALRELAQAQADALRPLAHDPQAMVARLRQLVEQDDRSVRILARHMLAKKPVADIQDRFPVVELMVQSLRDAGVADPGSVVATGLAQAMGGLLFGPWLAAATGSDALSRPDAAPSPPSGGPA